ncbi:MAG TPA: MBL fold metallo-hydrolase [Acidimicrobiaceae bacterium]|nr:MBL fold metallo-hydrolase [Acidimicrobiaceae bacterium]|tara:strand:+ start:718 stop:1617 length:900 start_codon:yes stop_codon:yes gene_type:complete
MKINWPDALELGPVTVLTGAERGKYPHGNSMLVRGAHQTILIDPSLTVAERGVPAPIDQVLLSHVHEDHIPGMTQLRGIPVSCHEDDAIGLKSIDGLMSMYGLPQSVEEEFRLEVVDNFYYEPQSNVSTFSDNAIFDLGGVEIQVIHTPGHTQGHCAFLIPQARTLFLGDIELSGFGPYYFDSHSSLESFEQSMSLCRSLDADHFVTFHHKWVISGRELFLKMLDDFAKVISNRELAMLDFMAEPKTVDDCVAHRFVYRPSVDMNLVDHVETRSALIHINRMLEQGRVVEVSENTYQTV